MKTLTILLPDTVSQQVLEEAKRQNVDAATLCSGIVAEHILEQVRDTLMARGAQQQDSTAVPSNGFDVKHNFPNFPLRSVELAQRFVDTALKSPGARAFKAFSGRGVGIEPNFVFVEYLLKRHPAGIGVSFYGSPDSLKHRGLRPGRNPNYSRSTAHNPEELEPLLQLIPRAYQLKFGR